MGIDLATWHARIGLNYYHACRPLQTRWRSSGGQLGWSVGEVMNDTPLVLKGCMAVIALSLILQYITHTWPKLKGRGGDGKLHCHWHGTTISQVGETGCGGGTLLLKAFVVVIPLLLIMAGDVELNPGPDEPSLKALLNELHPVRVSWYNIGVQLDIPHATLDCFKQSYSDPSDLMREMLKCWLDTAVDPRPTWEVVITALKSPIVDKKSVAEQLQSKYCKPVGQKMKESSSPDNMEHRKDLHDQNNTTSMPATHLKATDIEHQKQHSYAPTLKSTSTSPNRHSSSNTPTPSGESQKPPFGCGCGKCTFLTFIERGCPNPIPTASSFPYLDLSRLTDKEQQELLETLQFESQAMIMRFQQLVSTTIKSLQSQCIPPDELVSHVMTLGAFDPVIKKPQVPLFQYCFHELRNADTIPKVFLILNDYFSFFNYDIIEHIIKVLGTSEDKTELQRYKEDFNQYTSRRVYECMPQVGPVSETNHADIFVKVDSRYDNYTLAEIKRFCKKLSEILHVSSEGVLRLCQVEKGCFQLMFQVPSFVQQDIFPLSREQERALTTKGITRLTCGQYQFPKDSAEEPQFDASGEEIKAYELERKIPQLDIDQDSAMGISIFTGGKSTTVSEDPLDKEMEELDYELRMQGLEGEASADKYVEGLELHHAARAGQLETVKFLVEKKHCSPMYGNQNGDTALHLAAVGGSLEVPKYFITETNCNPACLDKLGLTPLHLASRQGHLHIVQYLVSEQQIDPECKDQYGNTPLHRACAGGNLKVVRFITAEITKYTHSIELLSDIRNKWNSTPLHTAVINGHLDIVRFFISEQKCDPNIPGQYGGTPLHKAARNGHIDVVKFLALEMHCDPMCRDSEQNTPLHLAAWNGHIDVVKFLTLEMHCDSTCRNSNNATAVHIAAGNGHLDIVRFFISEQKCDPNIPGQYGGTPLHYAAEFGHLHIVKYFTDEHGCNLLCLNDLSQTPLHRAALNGQIGIMKFLTLEMHCDPMCRDSEQDTPLHLAAWNGHIDVVKFLTLEIHCDSTCRNSNNATALHLAARNGHLGIVQLFTSKTELLAKLFKLE